VVWSIFAMSMRQWLNRPWEVVLALFLPIVFFSIFATIFGRGLQSDRKKKISISVIDEVSDHQSIKLIEVLKKQGELQFVDLTESVTPHQQAKDLIQRGEIKACLVIKIATTSESTDASTQAIPWAIDILSDQSDQLAAAYVESALQRHMMQLAWWGGDQSNTKSPTWTNAGQSAKMTGSGRVMNDRMTTAQGVHLAAENEVLLAPAINAGTATYSIDDGVQVQTNQADQGSAIRKQQKMANRLNDDGTGAPNDMEMVPVKIVNLLGDGKANPVISMYAAGIAVMFLLFNATTVGGILIEERSNQTLDRLLSSNLTMDQLLLGKWFYMTFLGVLQITVMFVWASLVFKVDLAGHFDGFMMMTIATSLAASGFGLFMATLCKSRTQLTGVSTMLVLSMSAMGGSMIPRYLMSESLQKIGLLTFNAWAIDGYDKVFWREMPVGSLAPQLAVLALSSVLFLCIARLLAIRWEVK